MANDWPRMSIAECSADEPYSTQIGPFGKTLTPDEYTPTGIPLLRGINVNHGRFFDSGFVFIGEETADRLKKYESYPGDVLLVHKGTLGKIGLMPLRRKYSRYIMGNSMLRVKCDPTKLQAEYLYYWLSSAEGQHYLFSHVSQVGVPQINRPLTTLREARLPVPPLPIQHRIANILGTLDDKIELNRRMNRTLEKMAAAIFKSWFIDFDPVRAKMDGRWQKGQSLPGLPADLYDLFPAGFQDSELGPIPEGWEVKPLDEIADYLNGLACQKHPPVEGQKSLPVIKIRELRQGITNNTDRASVDVPPKYIVEDGDVLFSWSGSLLVTIWCNGRGVLNQHVFKVTSASYPKWYFYQATKHHLDEFQRIATDKATTMGHIKRHHLTDAKMAIPGEMLMAKGSEVLGAVLNRRINALKQARILTLARDTLLPKLLSGEIDPGILPEVETLGEGVS